MYTNFSKMQVLNVIFIVKSCEKPVRHAVKSAAGLIRVFVILVLLLSVMAWAVKAGHLNSVTGVFPWLENFADWQISKVNEVVEFLREFFSKK